MVRATATTTAAQEDGAEPDGVGREGLEMKKTEAQSKNFEAGLAALEKIVRELERGDLPLEESLRLFEEGVRLSRQCQERLNQAERRIEVLLRDGEGRPVLSAFDEDAELHAGTGGADEAENDESVF
jgi:exodeoxyribonuclease VII small subunit